MGSLMVCKPLGECQQFRLTIHGQRWQMDNFTVGAGFLAANTYLHAIAVAKDGRQQGQTVENVFCAYHGVTTDQGWGWQDAAKRCQPRES